MTAAPTEVPATATSEAPAATPEPPTEVPSPTAEVSKLTANSSVNVRSGPGTNYPQVGRLQAGESYVITGKNPTGDWWQFDFNGQKAAGYWANWCGRMAVNACEWPRTSYPRRRPDRDRPPVPRQNRSHSHNRNRSHNRLAAATTLRGRLEVRSGVEAHQISEKEKAISDCNVCHKAGAVAFQSVSLTIAGPDGRPIRHAVQKEVLTSLLATESIRGFYAIGSTRIKLLDILLVLVVLGAASVPLGHMTVKRLFKGVREKRDAERRAAAR